MPIQHSLSFSRILLNGTTAMSSISPLMLVFCFQTGLRIRQLRPIHNSGRSKWSTATLCQAWQRWVPTQHSRLPVDLRSVPLLLACRLPPAWHRQVQWTLIPGQSPIWRPQHQGRASQVTKNDQVLLREREKSLTWCFRWTSAYSFSSMGYGHWDNFHLDHRLGWSDLLQVLLYQWWSKRKLLHLKCFRGTSAEAQTLTFPLCISLAQT